MIFSPQPAVVYIITKLELGGAQKVCLSLFKELQKRKGIVYLITGSEGLLVDQVKDLPNVFLLKSLKREVRLFSLISEIKAFFSMIRILRSLKKKHADLVVHTHGSKAGALGRLAAFFAGIGKRVHTIHGFSFHGHTSFPVWLVLYFIELLCSPLTTHYVCVSNADVQTGIKQLPFFKEKYSLIRAAVDIEYFYTPARQASAFPERGHLFIFGTIACFKKQKNIFDTLKAFQHAYEQNRSVRLEIVGDGVLRPAIEGWIKEHNLHTVITLHGWQHDVKPFLSRWHSFVLTSLWEGLPCALIEARLSRLPVLCYDAGGIRDVIYHGVNGFVYPQYEWKQVARGMLSVAADELLFVALRHYPDNLTDFGLTTMIHKHEQMYSVL